MAKTRTPIPIKTYDGGVVRFSDLDFSGNWVAVNVETGETLHDSRTDGFDVPPLIGLCPVTSMFLADGNFYFISLLTHWEEE